MGKDTYLKKILGEERFQRIKATKILMVGAGGIGCELLKDLVLTGYGEIHIVDLDTITLSNLNRQFLFRHNDIDKSKALTVAKAVESFNYFQSKLVPHHGNIMDTKQFPISWWDQFSFIFNALDNLEARRHVNKMSLFMKKPLMESGTTGFEGQIQPIYPYYSECFDCEAKVTPKTFPVCTIRSTPSQPVHCITWAKEFLYHQLFEEIDDTSMNDISKLKEQVDDSNELENMTKEVNELFELRNLITNPRKQNSKSVDSSNQQNSKSVDSSNLQNSLDSPFFMEIITKIFKVDVERLLLIESLWKSRQKPIPLDFSTYRKDVEELDSLDSNLQDTKVWTLSENTYMLYKACEALQKRINSGQESFIEFDKDDEDTLNFVVTAANLRCFIFHIEVKSKFDIKQIAGNIIPAIATTNAIISGFSSLSGTNYFKYNYDETKSTDFTSILKESSTIFISIRPNKYITSASLVQPNERCASSSLLSRGLLRLTEVETKELTLQWLVDTLIEKYGYEEDGVSIILGKSKLIYDIDFDDNLEKKLAELPGFEDGELILVQDDNEDLENLELYITTQDESEVHKLPDITLRPKKVFADEKEIENGGDQEASKDSNMIVIEEDEDLVELMEPALKKRKM
jgi:Dinucleotide-utilizing enzymes involved in molybdopterin and thiamine biosynthesis family 2